MSNSNNIKRFCLTETTVNRTLISVVFSFIIAVAAFGGSKVAVIIKTKGTVSIQGPSKNVWVAAEKGEILQSGTKLKTESDGLAMIKFLKDGSMMRLKPGTEIKLLDVESKERKESQGTRISLGSVLFNIKKKSAEDGFIVKTPTSVATVKGTRFHVIVSEDSTTLVVCENGSVNIKNIFSDKEKIISSGYTAVSDVKDIVVRKTGSRDTGADENDRLLEINFIDKDDNSKKLLIRFENTDTGK